MCSELALGKVFKKFLPRKWLQKYKKKRYNYFQKLNELESTPESKEKQEIIYIIIL
jgi:hypothetical protein